MDEKPLFPTHIIGIALLKFALRGWYVAPLMVLAAGARATTHNPSIKNLESMLKLPIMEIMNIFKHINIIATQYAH